MKSNAT